jgi:hypothetical protein
MLGNILHGRRLNVLLKLPPIARQLAAISGNVGHRRELSHVRALSAVHLECAGWWSELHDESIEPRLTDKGRRCRAT